MISFLRRYHRALFIAVIVVFLIGTFVGLGGYLFTSRDTSAAVASVGAVKIPYQRFMIRVNQYAETLRGRGAEVDDAALKQIKQLMLQDMIVDELLQSKADELGLAVTDEELARDIQTTPGFQRGGAFNQDVYFAVLRGSLHETPEGYEAARRRTLKTMKLKQLIFQTAKLGPDEVREAYAAAHKGSLKDFEKGRAELAAKLQQQRAVDMINYYLRQLSTQVEIRSYLDQRETGA